jgi:superoxide dismutase
MVKNTIFGDFYKIIKMLKMLKNGIFGHFWHFLLKNAKKVKKVKKPKHSTVGAKKSCFFQKMGCPFSAQKWPFFWSILGSNFDPSF